MSHPQLFEALAKPIEDALRASIRKFGMLVPIAVDQHGAILDGRHRKRIATEVGAQLHYTVITVTGQEQADEIQRTLNADRRHLSGEQLREHIVFLAQQVNDRGEGMYSQSTIAKVAGVDQSHVNRTLTDPQVMSTHNLPDRRKGADGKSYPAKRPPISSEELDQLRPENFPPLPPEPHQVPEPSQRPNIASASNERERERASKALSSLPPSAGQVTNARGAAQLAARERKPEPVAEPVAVPDGKYSCIVIDPPWPMGKIEREERPDQGQALDYSTMPVFCERPIPPFDEKGVPHPCFDSLCDCPEPCGRDEHPDVPCRSIECVVGNVLDESAHDDCHLYLWVTHKFLPDGMRLLESWGFRYQCLMTWRKNVGITPYSWMYDTEHVLFARKGNLKLTRMGLRLSFDAAVQGHSVKPDVFYDRVREASPGPRLDMFPGVEHHGFEPWGLEATHRGVV